TGILNPNGGNTIAIAVWNLDGSTGGLGKVELTNYGSYTSPLRAGLNDSPRYDPRSYAMPWPPGATVGLDVPSTAQAGKAFTATATVTVPANAPAAFDVIPALNVPSGWAASPADPARAGQLAPG